MRKTPQLKLWQSKYGRDYLDSGRGIVDPKTRLPYFKLMIGKLLIKTILEVGCGAGHNLAALSSISNYELFAVEPEKYALEWARKACPYATILEADCYSLPFPDNYFDLVFTCGVLVHSSPDDILRAVKEVSRVSGKYILVIEYYATEEEMYPITVDGKTINNFVWRRDYRKVFDLTCLGVNQLGEEFANCVCWLFGKG